MREKRLILHKFSRATITMAGVLLLLFTVAGNWQNNRNSVRTDQEIVVVFHEAITPNELMQMLDPFGDKVTLLRHIEDYALLSVADQEEYSAVLESLQRNDFVSVAEANSPVISLGFNNDTFSETQWALENRGHYIYQSQAGSFKKQSVPDMDMDVPEAWEALSEMESMGREVVVAIIDTGVDYTHPDLADSMWVNEKEIGGDGIDNDNNGYVDDIYGWDFYNNDSSVCHYVYSKKNNKYHSDPEDNDDHGTHVAGIIGATADNNIGIAGVASNIGVKLMSLKINGGKDARGSISGAIEAVKYATKMGADICNLSWGTTQYSAALELVMAESDMLFVAAAGNTGTNNDSTPIYPACLNLDNLLSITFIDAEGKLTRLSNYGTNTVDMAAPGTDIYSTVVGSYASMSGSSMAAPQVTGIAALLYSTKEQLYAVNVKEVIMRNRKEIPGLGEFVKNNGIPSAYKAVTDTESLVPDTIVPTIDLDTIYKTGLNTGEMIIPVFVEDLGNSHIRVVKWLYGDKQVKDFARGTEGYKVTENQIMVQKGGTYTFYASDYSGNETVKTYEVKEDKEAPEISASFTVAENYKSRTISVNVIDKKSGVKRVKYMEGRKKAKDFLPANAGTAVKLTGDKGSFKVKKDGIYTIFASDYRGNLKTITIEVKTVKADSIKFPSTKKTVTAGDKFKMAAVLSPKNTTDRISYSSSDKSVLTITSTGTVKALSEGKAVITCKTAGGRKAVCEITVKPK